MSSITRFAFVMSIFVLIMGLSACDQLLQFLSDDQMTGADVPQFTDLSGDISVGVVLPLSGRLASSFGAPMDRGLQMALDEINRGQLGDARISFIVEDDMSTVDGAVAAYKKLIDQDGVSVILGPATSSMTKDAFPIAEENSVVAISPTSAARGLSAIGDYVFRVSLATDVLIPNGISATHAKLGYERAATMYDEADPFSVDSENALQEGLAGIGVEVLATETFESGATDFSAQLTRIMEVDPQIVFVSSLPPEKLGILTQAREIGIPITVPIVLRTLTAGDVEAAGSAAEGAMTFTEWASASDKPRNQAFVQNYTAKHGVEPSNYASRAYGALYVLAEAIANAGSAEPTAIRNALANIKDLDTIFGSFSFNEVGDAVYDPIVLIVENGELKIFE
jgi:branched-chain amino acid transport system substrate-binding protein